MHHHTSSVAAGTARQLQSIVGLAAIATTLAAGALAAAGSAHAATLHGTVTAGEKPLSHSRVQLRAARRSSNVVLGTATTNGKGRFSISYGGGGGNPVLYAVATGGRHVPAGRTVRMAAVAGRAKDAAGKLTVNELSTVAAAYSLDHFLSGKRLHGSWPGLPNAAGTVPSFVDASSGALAVGDLQPAERDRDRQPGDLRHPGLDPRRLHARHGRRLQSPLPRRPPRRRQPTEEHAGAPCRASRSTPPRRSRRSTA